MSRKRIVHMGVCTVLLVAGVAACGSSKKATSNKTAPAATTTTTVGTTTTTINPDQAKATAAVLTLSDLPAGWTSSPNTGSSDNSPGDSAFTTQLASCLGVPVPSLDANGPQANSDTFSDPNETATVDDQVQVYPTAAAAAADYALFASPKTPGCLTKLFNGPLKAQITGALQPGQTVGSLTTAAKPFPQIADHSADIQVTFVITMSGVNVKGFVDLIVVIKGRSASMLTVTQAATLAVPTLGAQVAKMAAAHMTA